MEREQKRKTLLSFWTVNFLNSVSVRTRKSKWVVQAPCELCFLGEHHFQILAELFLNVWVIVNKCEHLSGKILKFPSCRIFIPTFCRLGEGGKYDHKECRGVLPRVDEMRESLPAIPVPPEALSEPEPGWKTGHDGSHHVRIGVATK